MKGGLDGGEYGFELLTVVVGLDADGDEETTCVVQFTDVGRQAVVGQKGGKPKELDSKAVWKPLVLDEAKALLATNAGTLTQAELIKAVLAQRAFVPDPDKPDKRDYRPSKINGAIEELVKMGRLLVDEGGRVSMPDFDAQTWGK